MPLQSTTLTPTVQKMYLNGDDDEYLLVADYSVAAAQQGIVYIDEVGKITKKKLEDGRILADYNIQKRFFGTCTKARQYELQYVLQDKRVLLTTYDIVRNNVKALSGDYDEMEDDAVTWDYMILDEFS
ncbi:hypothetical protein M8C21_007466 [Ambrosia artemisiifolia]|uniref:Uncharacterized protein n=1 Tax=Ambrosia artemisiifolia TaxID=4212 RepID=A0AAD5C0D7_AMBAR|nr:hypothetical protein M8C21_007466 [Ambrosia artemisiifolia]